MATTILTLETLHKLSDGLVKDFSQQLDAAMLDCSRRPSLAAKREVSIKLIIIPHPADADDVKITPIITSKLPAREIEPIRARRSRSNQLQFDFLTDDEETA